MKRLLAITINSLVHFLKSKFQRLPPKNIEFRDYKKFDEKLFLQELGSINFGELFANDNADNYDILTKKVRAVIDKHAPIKSKK